MKCYGEVILCQLTKAVDVRRLYSNVLMFVYPGKMRQSFACWVLLLCCVWSGSTRAASLTTTPKPAVREKLVVILLDG